MHKSITNLNLIKEDLKSKIENIDKINIIAVSKTFPIEIIKPLIESGHLNYGENKVQEAISKWTDIKLKNPNIKLHLIGKLQTNKVKFCIKLFDYIHSLDSEKLAKKIADEEYKQNKKTKIFIQVNIGDEAQKSGIPIEQLDAFYNYCSKELKLNILGLMAIPPNDKNAKKYFKYLNELNKSLALSDLSMGISEDYLGAVANEATFVRIGSSIFGSRS